MWPCMSAQLSVPVLHGTAASASAGLVAVNYRLSPCSEGTNGRKGNISGLKHFISHLNGFNHFIEKVKSLSSKVFL